MIDKIRKTNMPTLPKINNRCRSQGLLKLFGILKLRSRADPIAISL